MPVCGRIRAPGADRKPPAGWWPLLATAGAVQRPRARYPRSMAQPGKRRWALTPDVVRAALHDPDLRRLQLSWMAVNAGRWAFLITNLVVAYDAGGPGLVGILGLATFIAPMILSPFVGIPTARWRPDRILATVGAIRVLTVALTVALVALDGPLAGLVVLVALEAAAGSFARPLQMSMLPLLARSPAELVAAGAATGAAEGIGVFAGPAVAGLLLGQTGPVGAYLSVLAAYAFAVAAIARLDIPATPRAPHDAASVRIQLARGARAVVAVRTRLALFAGIATQTFVRGALTVLTVVAAIELLGMGSPGVGLLNAAIGVGGFLGALASITLANRTRLAPAVSVAFAMWGAPIVLIAIGEPAVALAAMVAVGTSNAILDVALFTLLLRTTPNADRAPVLGVLDSVAAGSQAIGGLAAPVLLAAVGIQGAIVVIGLLLPIYSLVSWPAVRNADDETLVDPARLGRIRGDPLFAPLSMAIVEQLAAQLRATTVAAGEYVVREGDTGDRYYLLDRGRVEVSQGDTVLRQCGPGDGFGEIALLRSVPRTASVRALDDVTALVLDRDDFLEAVTGHPASARAADSLVARRLGGA